MERLNQQPDYPGLSSQESEKRLKQYGPNKIEEKKAGLIEKILKWLMSPISLMLLAAALLSFVAGKIFDFYFILFLMLLNFLIGFWQTLYRRTLKYSSQKI